MRRATVCAAALAVVVSGAMPGIAASAPEPTDEPAEEAAAKIEPMLQAELSATATTDFWVRFEDAADLSEASRMEDWAERGSEVAAALRETAEASQADVRAELDADGVRYEAFWATNAIYVQDGSDALAAELAAHPEVDSLHPTTTYEVPDPEEGEEELQVLSTAVEWGIANINADDVWEQYGVRGAGITIANIDTGVQFSHPALVDQYRGNLGDGVFDHNYNWFDATGRCAGAPCDTNGHGTHTMGTMAGDDGGDNKIGVAPEVTWIAANGCCPTDAALITSGQWMLEPTDLAGDNPDASKRPHIINNSWGSEFPTDDPFMEDIALAWEASGIFAVWSNGNNGPACRTSGSPGSRAINYSTGAYDADNQIAAFSSRGPGQDGEIKPNISAPGVNIRSALPGSRYGVNSGTSMAAPHVASAVALLWSAAPSLVGDVEGTRTRLDGTATDSPDETCGGTAEDNNVFGEGRLDALALVDSAEVENTGTLAVTVTDADSGDPIAGAELSISGLVDRDRVTGPDGTYSVALPPGDYTVTASAFGYPEQVADVTIVTGQTFPLDLALEALSTVTVRGQVTDGSGHGWPLYASLTVDGMPGGPIYTKPANGRYSLTLPANETIILTARSQYDGYETVTEQITVGESNLTHDIAVPVNAEGCLDVGYEHAYDGLLEGFDDPTLPDGWSIVDNSGSGHGWHFDDPRGRGNLTGGEGGFAIADRTPGLSGELDASLVTPVVDLTGHEAPMVRFRQDLNRLRAIAHVDLSVDGGASWETLLEQDSSVRGPAEEIIPIPQAADQSAVQVRFRLFNHSIFSSRFWQIDDVFVGTRSCEPVPTGLVVGHVHDRNTGAPVNGAMVTSDGNPEETAESVTTPDDADLDDGFYWLFSSLTGRQSFTAAADLYQPDGQRAAVDPSRVTERDFRLPAGQLNVEPADLATDVTQGRTGKVSFTIANTGTAPARVELRERDSSYEIPRASEGPVAGADVVRIPGEFSPLQSGESTARGLGPWEPDEFASAAAPWIDLPDYPIRVMDNAVGELDGKIYSAGGRDLGRQLTEAFVYDPAEKSWSPIADLPEPLQAAAGAVIDGKFYVAGGWPPLSQGSRRTYIYDPETDAWSTGADAPFIFAAAGRAVLDDQLYIVGGCTNNCLLNRVHRYDPASDSWEELARYPEITSHLACAGIASQVYCAGGTRGGGVTWNRTYAYDPATDTWTRKADLPIQLWGMSYTASSDRLVVSGGVTGGATDIGSGAQVNPTALTNESFSYEPATDAWTRLPASNNLTYRAGNTCGLVKVGGTMVVGFAPVDSVEMLPTYGDCVPADVPWLSLDTTTVTLAPGQKVNVTATLDATDIQPGEYAGGVWIKQDTPYLVYPADIAMTVSEPKGGI
ncbi:MAG TPA: S8 family serine peptidase [Jiangellaceae bacterium]